MGGSSSKSNNTTTVSPKPAGTTNGTTTTPGDNKQTKTGEEEEVLDHDALASAGVDIQLLKEQLDHLFHFKVLLLGAGESGKSTVVKQLKLIHKAKVADEELQMIATSLHQNVVDCLKALLHAAETFGYPLVDADDEELKGSILETEEVTRLTPHDAQRIIKLVQNDAIQKTYARRNEFWLLDSWPYYLNNLVRFCEPDFVPTEEDSVMARVRTTGIVVSELDQKIVKSHPDEPEEIKFQVVDVGGQRNERKKWMHCFDDVSCILFIVNLAGYNQVLFEDSNKNRMIEELELFESITNNKMFEKTPIFLFLNKKDLFESMVLEVDMKKTFNDYTGGLNLQNALDYIENRFRALVPPEKRDHFYVHFVSARWKRDIKGAFEDVKKTLYDNNREPLLKEVKKIKQSHSKAAKEMQKKADGGATKKKGCFG